MGNFVGNTCPFQRVQKAIPEGEVKKRAATILQTFLPSLSLSLWKKKRNVTSEENLTTRSARFRKHSLIKLNTPPLVNFENDTASEATCRRDEKRTKRKREWREGGWIYSGWKRFNKRTCATPSKGAYKYIRLFQRVQEGSGKREREREVDTRGWRRPKHVAARAASRAPQN